ncbi:TetR/AcrR family transcriptional regulator [Paenibacillus nanensis]|uniref:TetR/AcrR family transcriptional regulator n=1 Tax=Paenibacillus nanensis TaxID=393251 RepID=A0A3A1VKQ1_9BACL|nr:TetR/AcrR family transcriptional regulator [Paenibacillus nanensis]RIX60332.1 TetR/AcrR family transcriptional regulator [Paenibacillus nanensis]
MAKQSGKRMPGRPKAAENGKSTKEVILQTAIGLFINNGYQVVSIDDIAHNAQVTKASVYYYFESKAELFKESIVALMVRIRERINEMLGADKPLYERLMDVTVAHLRATMTIDMDGFMRESRTSLSGDQVHEIKAAEENMFVSIEQAFLEAIEKGEIPRIHAKFAAHSYIALVKVGNYRQADGASLFADVEEAASSIMRVFWKGFIGE